MPPVKLNPDDPSEPAIYVSTHVYRPQNPFSATLIVGIIIVVLSYVLGLGAISFRIHREFRTMEELLRKGR